MTLGYPRLVEPVIRFQNAQEICATWGAVVIRICDGARTEIEDLVRVEKLFDELLETRPVVGMLLVFNHGTPMPTTATQRYAAQAMGRYGEKLVFVVAMLGLGFWASAFRAAVDTVVRVLSKSNTIVEGSVEAAITRLSNELIGIDPDGLLSVYQDLSAELERSRVNASSPQPAGA